MAQYMSGREYNDSYKDEREPDREYDLTDYEMRAEKLKQAAKHIAEYSRRLEEINMRREKTRAILNEMGVCVSELYAIEVSQNVLEDIYGITTKNTQSYPDGYKSDPHVTLKENPVRNDWNGQR